MEIDLTVCPSLTGRSLRRWRRVNDVKQATVAEALGVSQATVSRWEAGITQPSQREQERLCRLLGARPDGPADRALLALVSQSREPVHLVCDLSHRLLAASPGRLASWRHGFDRLQGTSLWPAASEGIARAELSLAGIGWYDRATAELEVETGAHVCRLGRIDEGVIVWTRMPLSNGTMARLVRDGRRGPARAA
ncbi:helix-turn-helix transcriptional regulator [Poseidonocella sp. HB161398]|uniref:helix-turn-helix domain-containing protein n=1 Tax=Poseidonocella sp. HB161398 TaxID=2320855 RepID=UPI001108232E|nr:helix-turn-helix transcriptional regulator [Poseidonocella sp. HB161398]